MMTVIHEENESSNNTLEATVTRDTKAQDSYIYGGATQRDNLDTSRTLNRSHNNDYKINEGMTFNQNQNEFNRQS